MLLPFNLQGIIITLEKDIYEKDLASQIWDNIRNFNSLSFTFSYWNKTIK